MTQENISKELVLLVRDFLMTLYAMNLHFSNINSWVSTVKVQEQTVIWAE